MDQLKQEILERKRKLEQLKVVDDKKKFFKRSELAKREEEEYLAKQKTQSTSQSRQASVITSSGLANQREAESDRALAKLSAREVTRRLRVRKVPIRLFGETDEELRRRLRIVESMDSEEGLRNDLQAAMEQVDEEYLREWMSNGHQQLQQQTAGNLDVQSKETNISEAEKLALINRLSGEQLHEKEQMDIVLKFFKHLLSMWASKLNSRPSVDKQSSGGRMASARYNQTIAYIQPLFKALKDHKVGVDIADNLAGIVRHLLLRDYISANKAYMELAIGNAPWPLGVTNHGIHSRPAQAGIHAKNVAHVLNDETQRKYIQSIKRLMSLAQELFPTDPHRCVNYMGPDLPSYRQ